MLPRRLSFVLAASAVGALFGAPAAGQDRPCDPWTRSTPVARPAAPQCGNGRVDSYPSGCRRVCSGGCGHPTRCSVRCDERSELCDGADLGGHACVELGYAGGTLRCSPRCDYRDARGCDPCFAGPGVTCGHTTLRGLTEASVIGVAGRADEVGVLLAATRGGRDGVFFGVFDGAALRLRRAFRPLSSGQARGLAATDAGYLTAVGQRGAGHVHRVQVHTVDARGRARVSWEREADEVLEGAVLTGDRGEPLLWLVQGYPPRRSLYRLADDGTPAALPERAVHATGAGLRVLAVPVRAGHLPVSEGMWSAPRAPRVETRAGDHVVVTVPDTCGSTNGCEVAVAVQRGLETVATFGRWIPAVDGPRPLLELPLPGGGRLAVTQDGRDFRDRVEGPHALAVVSPAAEGGAPRVFGGLGLGPTRFAPTRTGRVGVTTMVDPFDYETLDGPEPVDRAPRLFVARVRAPDAPPPPP